MLSKHENETEYDFYRVPLLGWPASQYYGHWMEWSAYFDQTLDDSN